jgi:type VI protein secretion system component Hcp
MAPAYFLKIDGISGESLEPEHVDELELESFVWGESGEPTNLPTTATFTFEVNKASPALFLACATGRRISGAVLSMREERPDGDDIVRKWRFSDVVVANYATVGSDAQPLDSITLNAAEVTAVAPPERSTLRLRIIRPDDLLNLEIEGVNLRLDRRNPAKPAVVVSDPEAPARLIVLFPPQTIAETAYFEAAEFEGEVAPPIQGNPPEPNPAERPLDPPGSIGPGRDSVARVADPSRLVFDVEPGTRIPCTIEGLLDWSSLQLAVNPIAAIPPEPSPDQIADAPAIRPPEPTETALELPYRLVVSPGDGVAWVHRTQPFTSRGRTELWHTRLALRIEQDDEEKVVELTKETTAPLRAIWSPDHNQFQPPAPSLLDPNLGLTAMSPNDRHQIVILTSAFRGYEYEVELDLDLPGPILDGPGVVARFARIPFKLTFPYVPKPFFAELLMLSPLGGWLRSRGEWTPPYQVLRRFPFLPDLGGIFALAAPRILDLPEGTADVAGFVSPDLGSIVLAPFEEIGERLDLSEWVHIAAQGRDHYVRIVYEGELKPFGNAAALIKVTERKFEEQGSFVGAYLRQRMFIVVREPVKMFDVGDRGMPFKKVQLTTLVTPDIAEPDAIQGTIRSFWVEVKTGGTNRARFMFHGVGTDISGNEVDFTVPMMFVSIAETDNTLPVALDEYNRSGDASTLTAREARIPGQQLAFAAPDADPAKRNTQLVTEALNFVVDPSGDPQLLKADVMIPQVQEILGTDAATTIRLFEEYVAGDFDGATGVFAEIVKPDFGKLAADPLTGMIENTLGVDFSSDKAGGFATPNLGVSTLTRSLGPLAGKAADAVTDTFDPASFFGGGLAHLFGSFDLADILPVSTLGKNAPKLRTSMKDIPGGKLIVTTIEWEPEVKNKDLTVVEFVKDHNGVTALKVNGLITKPVGPPDPATFEFTGELNDFRVGVLKSVFINFVLFSFSSESGQKPAVKVELDPNLPVEFAGDLKFVEELRKAIPPGLFGDGPSLEITPTGIRAGFAIALPPIAVGVFALKDVSLGAFLALPFTDGKPTFDFNVSAREQPFLLSVSIFGGGGFFHLQLDTAGMKEIEAAFEFGVTASLDLGVASGSVHMMAGIYFSLVRQDPGNDYAATLSGYLRVGGSMRVLGIITVSVEFNLSFTYDSATDKAYGRATLTVEVEVLFFSASVELTVERGFGGQSGDPKFVDMFTSAPVWKEYAKAFA